MRNEKGGHVAAKIKLEYVLCEKRDDRSDDHQVTDGSAERHWNPASDVLFLAAHDPSLFNDNPPRPYCKEVFHL